MTPAQPPLGILNPSFRYVPAAQTDIRKTFERVRKQLAAQKRKARRGAD